MIIILDSKTLNPGDLSWEWLSKHGHCEIYDKTPDEKILERCPKSTQIIITNKAFIGKEIISQLPELKLIAVSATGVNSVDLKAAKEAAVQVCNIPNYGSPAVAQHTFALILELINQIGFFNAEVQKGVWKEKAEWCFYNGNIFELKGKTIGLIGFGNIARKVAKIALAFEMKVIAFHPRANLKFMKDVHFVPIDRLFEESDILSLHCPLKGSTREIINKDNLAKMKPSALLINTARGGLINEMDLKNALENQVIKAAALDVLSAEPPENKHPLLGLENCIITPHNAWGSYDSRKRLMDILEENIKAFFRGEAINLV